MGRPTTSPQFKKIMINGKEVDRVHYRTMMRSIQRMQELNELKNWFVCDKGQLLTDFVSFSGVLPAPEDCIVTYKPIKSWQTGREFQWFCRIKDEEIGRYVYFTLLSN